jgi:hypothetical protein
MGGPVLGYTEEIKEKQRDGERSDTGTKTKV